MTREEFEVQCLLAISDLKMQSPIDTGNLRYNAIRLEFPEPFKCLIYVDENVAPYMIYTDGPWNPDNHYGHTNPNEGWVDEAVEIIAEYIAQRLKGRLRIS